MNSWQSLEPEGSHCGQTSQLLSAGKEKKKASLGRHVQLEDKDPGWETLDESSDLVRSNGKMEC